MTAAILAQLGKAVPAGAALMGLTRSNSQLSDFIVNSLSAGYGADQIIDFLRDKFQTEGEKSERNRLESLKSPLAEERLALSKNKQAEAIPKALAGAAGLAAGIGGLASGRTQQTLNPPMGGRPPAPPNLQIGNRPQPPGLPAPRQALPGPTAPQGGQPPQAPQSPAFNGLSLIGQFSPQLAQFVQQHIASGKTPKGAAILAKNSKEFGKVVSDIENQYRVDFIDVIDKLFEGYKANESESESIRKGTLKKFNEKKKPFIEVERDRFNQAYPESPKGPSAADQALRESLDRLNKLLGG